MKFANLLNNNIIAEENKTKLHFKKQVIKQFLKLKFSEANKSLSQLKRIKSIIRQASNSRSINKTKGSHYINNYE